MALDLLQRILFTLGPPELAACISVSVPLYAGEPCLGRGGESVDPVLGLVRDGGTGVASAMTLTGLLSPWTE